MRWLATDLTKDTSRGYLALSSSVGLRPSRMKDEGSHDLQPAPRLVHRR
jgi:hypothetical protein